MSSSKTIAKNTLFLYLRMLFTMGVSLYTSRIVLNKLGVEDFGIYNLVGAVVVLFSFINSAMTSATQRFLNFEMGKGDESKVHKVFCISMNVHFMIVLVVVFLSETIGLWFLNYKLNIPENRMVAANVVYQLSLITFSFNVLKVPYNASLIAHEKMSFYAWTSILEVFLKLAVVVLLIFFAYDKLIVYAILTVFVSVIMYFLYRYFCRKMFPICHYKYYKDKFVLRELLGFSGWSLFGNLALVASNEGLAMIMNIFLGVAINAAMGIATQVNAAVFGFVSNFQMAFNPQIVKSFAEANLEDHKKLIFQASKFSYYLLLILAIPILFNTEYILTLWLKIVPLYAVRFTQLTIVFSLIDALAGPFWMSAIATGKIKYYQLGISFIMLLNLPFSYLILKLGYSPVGVFMVKIILNLITYIFRVSFVKRRIHFSFSKIFSEVYLKVGLVSIVAFSLAYLIRYYSFADHLISFFTFVAYSVACLLLTLTVIVVLGFTKAEKNLVFDFIKSKIPWFTT